MDANETGDGSLKNVSRSFGVVFMVSIHIRTRKGSKKSDA